MTIFNHMRLRLVPLYTRDMKKTQSPNEVEESAYSLLVRSNETKRGMLETIIYSLMILCAIAAILQFVDQRDSLPLAALPMSASVLAN
jgi:hypothetical protein